MYCLVLGTVFCPVCKFANWKNVFVRNLVSSKKSGSLHVFRHMLFLSSVFLLAVLCWFDIIVFVNLGTHVIAWFYDFFCMEIVENLVTVFMQNFICLNLGTIFLLNYCFACKWVVYVYIKY